MNLQLQIKHLWIVSKDTNDNNVIICRLVCTSVALLRAIVGGFDSVFHPIVFNVQGEYVSLCVISLT